LRSRLPYLLDSKQGVAVIPFTPGAINRLMSLKLTVPSTCAVCKDSIAQSRAIFLHCDCCIAYCLNCVLTKIAHTDQVYHEFIVQCPKCNCAPVCNFQRTNPQIDETSKKIVELAVEDALESAFTWQGVVDWSKERHKDKVCSSKQLKNRHDQYCNTVDCIFYI
jgi:hypothetical protein